MSAKMWLRMSLATWLISGLLVAAPAGPAFGTAYAATPSVTSAINGFSLYQAPEALWNTQLATMRIDGVGTVRSDAPWADVEPLPPGPSGHVYDFATTDKWVTALAVHHLTWQPIVDYSVGWAKTCAGPCAPGNDGPYAAFAQAVAARYGVGGSFWTQHPELPAYPARIFEIWNEQGGPPTYISPARYDTLYAAARKAIHTVDPQAAVILGGLADDGGPFVAAQDYPAWYVLAMLAADPGLSGHIDGFGLHPYGATAQDVEDWVVNFRYSLDVWGEGSAPIYITEFGWPTFDASHETWRAGQMTDLAWTLTRSNCGVAMVAPYTWINPGSPPDSDFGLVDNTGHDTVLRPAGVGWFTGLTKAASLPELGVCGPNTPSITSATPPIIVSSPPATSSTGKGTGLGATGRPGGTPSKHKHRRKHHRHHRRRY